MACPSHLEQAACSQGDHEKLPGGCLNKQRGVPGTGGSLPLNAFFSNTPWRTCSPRKGKPLTFGAACLISAQTGRAHV